MDISQEILSDIIVFQKYAKYTSALNRREIWEEICDRNANMHIKKYPQLKDEITEVYRDYVYTKKVLPSMRSMQFAGRPIELNNTRIFNCAYAPVNHPFIFAEAMELLLGGCFKEGTLIKTKNGNKKIEDITINDEICTYNETIKEFHWIKPNWAGLTPTANKPKVKVTTSLGEEILTTADHKFLTDTGWKEAQHLTLNDKILSS